MEANSALARAQYCYDHASPPEPEWHDAYGDLTDELEHASRKLAESWSALFDHYEGEFDEHDLRVAVNSLYEEVRDMLDFVGGPL